MATWEGFMHALMQERFEVKEIPPPEQDTAEEGAGRQAAMLADKYGRRER